MAPGTGLVLEVQFSLLLKSEDLLDKRPVVISGIAVASPVTMVRYVLVLPP